MLSLSIDLMININCESNVLFYFTLASADSNEIPVSHLYRHPDNRVEKYEIGPKSAELYVSVMVPAI